MRALSKPILLTAVSLMTVGIAVPPALAQTAQQGQGQAAVAAPTLSLTGNIRGVRSDATVSRALTLANLELSVDVRGGIAQTVLTATFHNDSNDVLEGDFAFTMPAGSVVNGYALDVNGTMIDGVLAGRDQAREAYQRRVAQRIDPGLAEVDAADRFSTRVFPIPAGGSRTIRVAIATPIDPVRGLDLPMAPAGVVERLSLRVTGEGAAMARLPGGIAQGWTGTGDTRGIGDRNVRLSGTLHVPAARQPSSLVISRHANGEDFFTLDDVLPLSAAPVDATTPIHIVFDRSASRGDDAIADEAALIDAFLADSGARSITLTLFDSGGAETRNGLTRAQVASALADPGFGGGTSFATLRDLRVAEGALCLLVTDGLQTVDARRGFALPCRTHVITAARELDRGWLQQVAARGGGSLIELGQTTRGQALAALRAGAADIGRVTDSAGQPIDIIRLPAAEGHFRIVGPMPQQGGIRLLNGDRLMRSYERGGDAAAANGAAAIWASRQLAADAQDLSTRELVARARRYNVASPLASFIVLEQPADYVEADIPPPESYPKALRDQWEALRAQAAAVRDRAQDVRFTEVRQLWAGQVAWWERAFDPRAQGQGQGQGQGRPVSGDDDDVVRALPAPPPLSPPPSPPPPPPPPPPPVIASPVTVAPATPPSQAEEEADMAEIIVTGTVVGDSRASERRRLDNGSDPVAADAAAASTADSSDAATGPQGTIELAQWNGSRAWVAELDRAGAGWPAALQRLRREHGALPIFWLDVAEWHHRAGRAAEARRAAEAALDAPSRDNQTLSIVAARLQRYGGLDRAISLLERLADRENERPQPLRTLALALMDRAERRAAAGDTAGAVGARDDLSLAIRHLADAIFIIRRERFQGFETLALMEANLAVARYRALGGGEHALPVEMVRLLDTDIRVVMEWNTPRNDLDLWVTQPNGESVGFSYRLSQTGGKLSGDVTNGFGPEEFLLRRAAPGRYQVHANVFSPDRANPNGPSMLSVRIIRNWGRRDQSEQLVDVEMVPDRTGRQLIGTIDIR